MATTVSTLSEALELYNDSYIAALGRNSRRDIEKYQSKINQINSYFDIVSTAVSENNSIRAQNALDAIVAILVAEGITISDTVGLPLSTAVYASPGVITVPVDNVGLNPVFTNAKSTVYVYQGGTNQSSEYTISISAVSNVTATVTDNLITITGITADEGYVDILCTRTDFANLTLRIFVYKYYDADSGLTLDALPSTLFIPVDEFGNNADVTNAISTLFIRQGSIDETSNWTFSIFSVSNLTAVIQNSDEVKINTITADSGNTVIECTRTGYTTLYITVYANKYYDAEKGLAIEAYPSSLIIPVDSDGTNPQLTNAISTVILRRGVTDETALWTFAIQSQTDVTAVIQNDNEVKINTITADEGSVTIRCSRSGYSDIDIIIPVQKQYKGQAVVDGSSVDQLTIDLNDSDELIIKRDHTGSNSLFPSDTPDMTSYYNDPGTTEIADNWRLRSTNFRRVISKNDNGGNTALNSTFNISHAASILPYDSQGNTILGPNNFTEYLSGTSHIVDVASPDPGGASGVITFTVGQGDITSDYTVSSKILVYVSTGSTEIDSKGFGYYMSGTITASTFITFTTIEFDCDFLWTKTLTDYYNDEQTAGNDINAIVYTPYDPGTGSIGSYFNTVIGRVNYISGENNYVIGRDNLLINSNGTIIFGDGWEVVPTNADYNNDFGNILIGNGLHWSGTSNQIKGHRNLVIGTDTRNVIDHEDNNYNIIIGAGNAIGEYAIPQTYGVIYSTAIGYYNLNLANASSIFGIGAKATTNGQISFGGSRSEVIATKFILEVTTSSIDQTNIQALGRTTGSLFTPLVSDIIIENSRAFTGTLDVTGAQSDGSYFREKYAFSFTVDSSGVVTTKLLFGLADYTYNSDGFTGTIVVDVATTNTVQIKVTPSSSTSTNWVALVEGSLTDI